MSDWKWLGKNEFVVGVPARDLSDEEVDRRGIRHLVELSPLYEFVGQVPEAESDEEGEE